MSETRITVPDIGDAQDVDVVEVLVEPGTVVARDQSLIVLETEKASMEIPSPQAGVVTEVAVAVGDKVSEGALILTLTVSPADAAKPADSSAPDAMSTAVSNEATEPGTPAPTASRAPSRPRTIPPGPKTIVPAAAADEPGDQPHATPSVRKLARELGVDLNHVTGSGPRHRITREDVQLYVKHAMSVAGTGTGRGFAVPELPIIDFSQFGETTIQPLTKIQKISGRNLHRSWVNIPHVTQHDEADISGLEDFRKKMKAERPEVKLTLTSFFMKAVVVVLRSMPRFNASLDGDGENLIFKHYFNIGVAVDTPNGLMVPVIRDVETKGLHDLAIELSDVSERARSRRLTPQDMQGGSMTVSSLGGIGGSYFTPIINPPEVAVLGVSKAALKPVYVDGSLEPRLMCPLSLSYDHRVIDGADAARFITMLGEVLGDIRQMLL